MRDPMHTSSSAAVDARPLARNIARMTGARPGPTLICVGGVHGNEPAGLSALHRVADELGAAGDIERGEFLALAGNLAALQAGQRYIDWDLNRRWGVGDVALQQRATHRAVEDIEQEELLAELQAAFSRARGEVYLLDLHTTSGPGRPFSVFADTLQSRRFAQTFPNPLILGLEEHLDGTLVDYVGSLGHVAAAFEGGQHQDPRAPDNLAAAIWMALARVDILGDGSRDHVQQARRTLEAASDSIPPAMEIMFRYHIDRGDGFAMHPGFASFDRVSEGQLLARNQHGEISAPRTGYLLMPLYQEQGEEGFFIVRPVRTLWLTISRWLRLCRADKIVHWLPGVSRDPANPGVLVVDRHVARWVAMEVLHLLGYRKLADDGVTLRVMRRRHDRP
jgi:Succinylglutamate desuccinylase / Aspartoacylase family